MARKFATLDSWLKEEGIKEEVEKTAKMRVALMQNMIERQTRSKIAQ